MTTLCYVDEGEDNWVLEEKKPLGIDMWEADAECEWEHTVGSQWLASSPFQSFPRPGCTPVFVFCEIAGTL